MDQVWEEGLAEITAEAKRRAKPVKSNLVAAERIHRRLLAEACMDARKVRLAVTVGDVRPRARPFGRNG